MATSLGFPTLTIQSWGPPDTTSTAPAEVQTREFDPSKQLGLLSKQSDRMNTIGLAIIGVVLTAILVGAAWLLLRP